MEALTAADLPDVLMTINVTNLIVNGKGYFRTNNILIQASNVTVDLAGEMHADFSGFNAVEGPGSGMSKETYSRGGYGAGHGGRGGSANVGYQSAVAYDSIYMPVVNGSGGGHGDSGIGGGRGGGVFKFQVQEYMRIEGKLSANGEPGSNNGGGGAGGSIWCEVKHFDGEGTVEVTGGEASGHGGGGGGGRVAIYHSGENAWTGIFHMYGGMGLSHTGGSGTVFIEDTQDGGSHKKLMMDNNERTTSQEIQEVVELSLSGATVGVAATEFITYGGVHFSTTGPVYSHIESLFTPYYFSFYYIRDGPAGGHYRTATTEPVITLTFPVTTYVDHIRVFPHCDRLEHV